MSNMKFSKNDEGVSPIIATLVLIVVAIVGAAAVGLIMGTFSSNVASQASSSNTKDTASTQITIAGSTSMQPVITTLANWYNNNHTGVKLTVQGTGSGAGAAAVGMNVADIGMMSEAPSKAVMAKYPTIKTFQVGESGVVFVTKAGGAVTTVSKTDLQNVYAATPVFAGTAASYSELVIRSDASGTQDTAFAYLGVTTTPSGATVSAQSGNGNMVTEIESAAGKIGAVDSDYAYGDSKLQVLPITDSTGTYDCSWTNLQTQIKSNPSTATYPTGLLRPLNLITNGAPSTIEQSFINFCMDPANKGVFGTAHQVAVSDMA